MSFNLKGIGKKDIVIVMASSKGYKTKGLSVLKQLYTKSKTKNICYVNLNTPHPSLLESLSKNKIKIDNFLFIDCDDSHTKEKSKDNCIHVGSPTALTNLALSINKVLGTSYFNMLFFDSISALLVYNKPEIVTRFVHDLFTKIRDHDIIAVFMAQENTDKNVMGDLQMFADRTIKIK